MKLLTIINIEKKGKSARFLSNSSIYLKFEYYTHDDFHEWIGKNSSRMQEICTKWQWTYDIGHSDKVIYFSKT